MLLVSEARTVYKGNLDRIVWDGSNSTIWAGPIISRGRGCMLLFLELRLFLDGWEQTSYSHMTVCASLYVISRGNIIHQKALNLRKYFQTCGKLVET